MDPVLTLSDTPDPVLTETIHANFLEWAQAQGVPSDFRPISIRVERSGALLGGLVGRTIRQWLFIDNIALPIAEQGAQIGSRLIGMAEQEALTRGCTGAYLQTIQFQAPGFYLKLGYREFARLPHGADPRLDRIWFSKTFAP